MAPPPTLRTPRLLLRPYEPGDRGGARGRLGLARVLATVHPDNAAALRVLAKRGFREVARERDAEGATVVLEAVLTSTGNGRG